MKVRMAIVIILFKVLSNEPINYNIVNNLIDISRSSFKIAISDIRCTLADMYSMNELIFDRLEKSYKLI